MNVHPDYFGRGVARILLEWIVAFADDQRKPMRLVFIAQAYSAERDSGRALVISCPGRSTDLSCCS